ncbi:ALG3 protein-domain-containing protein [Lipomyces kononenkoae]|uniref:ALG3 protein-domain-containing protein n=1 Tax=Lipomyces kononenkoae TaxID=34357 RepID=A0ACC3SUY0_LIPKO
MDPRTLGSRVWGLVTGNKHAGKVACCLWVADLLLSAIIVMKVSYTEIDWKAYMEQVELYLEGERNYARIRGGTGPLVYPAGHVYIFSVLYKLTGNGKNILLAQIIFAALYLATLAVVFKLYIKAKAPLYAFPLVILSKRLHSIYMLRLFNDTFAIFVAYLSVFAWQSHYWLLGSIIYSFALSIKMNVLLFLPAAGIILLQALGPRAFRAALLMLQVQIILAYPFTSRFFISYVTRAFDFNRVFLYKWTVNWRFVDEAVFLTPEFSQTLLIIHGCMLLFFIFTRWIKPSDMNIINIIQTIAFPTPRPPAIQNAILAKMTPEYILKTLFTCNLIGVLCARSLHYQFYSWFAWSLPYLLSVTGWNPLLQVVVWVAEEWAWNIFPSTKLSSFVVVAANAIIIIGIWFGTKKDAEDTKSASRILPEMSSISVTESPPPVVLASPRSSPAAATRPVTKSQRRRKTAGKQ